MTIAHNLIIEAAQTGVELYPHGDNLLYGPGRMPHNLTKRIRTHRKDVLELLTEGPTTGYWSPAPTDESDN